MAGEHYYTQALQLLGLSKTSIISNVGMLRKEDSYPQAEINSSNVVPKFLSRIISFDYRAVTMFRYLTIPHHLSKQRSDHIGINCLDAVIVILNHCDDFTRQRVLECMAKCNLSVPILLPDLREGRTVKFQQWALASIIKPVPIFGKFEDVLISRHSFHVVFVVKIGEIKGFCMPDILNKMLGETQDNNLPYSFLGGNIDSSPPLLSNGLLEAVWFLPDNRNTSLTDWRLTMPACFSYLHGNPDSHEKEFEFGYASSTITVIFVSKESFNKYINKLSNLGKHKKIIIAILSLKRKRISNSLRGQHRIKVRDFTGANVTDIARALCTDISHVLKGAPPSTFTLQKAGSSICKLQGMPTDMNGPCQNGFDQAQAIEMQFNHSAESFSETFKLLQHWECFSKLYKDTAWKRARMNICHEIESHRQQLRQSRILQSQERLSDPMQFFLNTVEDSSAIEQLYILSWLKLLLKHKALSKVSGSIDDNLLVVQHKFDQMKFDSRTHMFEQKQDTLNVPCKKKTSEELTYGIGILLQELGQLYECRSYIKNDCFHIANVAANMVLNGHPIDIFDGKTGNVPIKWLESILKAVKCITGDKKVFVISILGVQSAGKSTFLNTLFGTNFEVNAGRCTKGVCIQMIQLDKTLSHETGCHFILIVDTEGLQPSQELYKVSNEMATFVLSFSNLTILNIAGQTIESDIKNILQIAALAFLRMNKVNLKCDCFVVQQLVSDPTALQKNEHDIISLCQNIEQAVQHAAKIENIEVQNSTGYPEIFKILNFKKGLDRLQYFPPLWSGRTMNPPDASYSELILELRKELINMININVYECLHLSVLTERVLDVWKAIKEDDFLFYFRNTEEMKQFTQFKQEYHTICANFSANMGMWKLKHLRKMKPTRDNNAIYKENERMLEEKLSRLTEEVCYQIDTLFLEERFWLIKTKNEYFKNDFRDRVSQTNQSILHSLQTSSKFLKSKLWTATATNISQALRNIAEVAKITTKDTLHSIQMEFKTLWESELVEIKSQFLDKILDRSLQEEILIEIANSLRDFYRDTLLEKDIKKNMFSLLTIQSLQGIIEDSKFLQYPMDERKTLSSYLKYLVKYINMSECPTLVNNVQTFVRNFVNAIKGKRVTDCSFVHKVFEVTTQFHGKISSHILAKVIMELCLWMAPLILRAIALSEWEPINANLENLRGDFYDEYVTARMLVSKREFQTNLCFISFIEQELVNNITSELTTTLLNQFTNTIFTSKENLLNNILLDLCEKRTFKDYIMYLTNTKGYIESWVLNFICESCVLSENNYRFCINIEKIAQVLIDEKLQIFRDILQKKMQNPDLEYHKLYKDLFRDIGRLSDVWYDQNTLEAFESALSFLSAYEFASEFSKAIDFLRGTLLDALKVPQEASDLDSVKDWFSNVAKTHKELIANLRMCFAVCPFCPVTCDETDYHEVHRSFRHLPKGLGGTRSRQHQAQLATEDCTDLVATESTYFRCRCYPPQCNHIQFYYKDYRLHHPNWYIHPQGMSEDQPKDYWKWVLKEFNSEFARFYQVHEADIPASWNAIAIDDAVTYIRCQHSL